MSAPDPDAPAVLTIDARGVVSLEIVAHDGEVIGYLVEPDPEAEGWGVVLRRLDCAAGPYRVSRPPGRLWRCDCPDARYRSRARATPCKHVTAVRGVYALVIRLLTTRQEPFRVTQSES